MNTPYRKVYENGILKNPITKEKPFRNIGGSRSLRRGRTKTVFNEVLKRNEHYRLSSRGEWINIHSVNAPKLSKREMNKLIGE